MMFSPSNNHDRSVLLAVTGRVSLSLVGDPHAARDEMGEWAAEHAEFIRALPDRTIAEAEFLVEADRARKLRESADHMARVPLDHQFGDDHFSPCGQSLRWGGPRQPRIARPRPARRSRWGRVLRSLVRFLMSPRAW